MLGSRSEKFRSIYYRVKGLINKNVISYSDRPIWFDVYEAFPPKRDPVFETPPPQQTVQNILYPEDCIRSTYNRIFRDHTIINMFSKDSDRTLQKKFITAYDQLKIEQPSISDEDAISLIRRNFSTSGILLAENKS